MHDALVPDHREDLPPRVQVAAPGLGDQPLGQWTQPPRLGLGRLDAAVLEQRRGEVRQHQALVRRAAAETWALAGLGHGSGSLLPRPYQVPESAGTAVGRTGTEPAHDSARANQYCSVSA